jgi:hypothetical protein
MLRVELAVLTGSAPGSLAGMPGGPIPLPPGGASAPDHDAAQIAAANAQAVALYARAVAATQTIRARAAGRWPTRETLAADRRALVALQAEAQARAAMAQAYVLGRDAAER